MNIEEKYKELIKIIDSSNVLKNESMKRHTSFKIGGNADILVKARTIEDVKKVLEFSNKNSIPIYVIGNGSNVLVKDKGVRGIVLVIQIKEFEIIKKENKAIVKVGAGEKITRIASECLKQEISGLEFASRHTRNNWRSN